MRQVHSLAAPRVAWVVVCAFVLLGAAWPRAVHGQPACPAGAPGGRYLVFVAGFLSSSLTGLEPGVLDAANHRVRDDFSLMRDALAAGLVPPPHVVYFSYGAARLTSMGAPPAHGWVGDTYFDAREPRYWVQDTSDYPLQAQANALGWLLDGILGCDPEATVDVVGFSLGGVVALRWAATADPSPESALAAVHRIVVVDSPVGGVNPNVLGSAVGAAPPGAAAAFGRGTVLADLLPGSEVIRSLPGAATRVDVVSIENRRDYLVNGASLPSAAGTGPDGWLARGAAVTFLPPERAPDAYYVDMGEGTALGPSLWDYLVGIHGAVLAHDGAHARLADLLATDGPLWQARQPASPASVPPAEARP